MNKLIKIISAITLFVILSGVTNRFIAQDAPIFIIEGRAVDATSKKVEGVTVVVKKGGAVVNTTKTSSNGKFQDLELNYGFVYTVTYSKSGYITKSISIDAKKDFYAEDVEDLSVFPADITMLKAEQNVNYSLISSSPVAKVKIDPATGGLDYDRGYISKRGKEIAKFLEEIANKGKKEAELFNKLVKEGDASVSGKNYEAAIASYNKALEVKDDAGVKEKIAQANHFLEKQKEAAARDKVYNEKMAAAAKTLAEKDYAYAKTQYQEAADIKPAEQAPKDKIKEIEGIIQKQLEAEQKYNQLMADGEKSILAKSYDDAISKYTEASKLKPSEQLPKDQLAKAKKLKAEEDAAAEKEKQYNDLITKADGLFDGEKLEEAKTAYQEALAIKAGEAHPTGRITEIDKKIADAAANAEKEKQYNDLIAKADGLFDGEKLEEAKTAYQEALAIKAGEAHPTGRITEIDKKIADAAANAEKEKQYNDLIAKADGLFDGEKLEEAKTAYQEALAIKAGEAHPTGRITEIDKKIADAAANAEKEKQYNDLITKADGLFNGEKLEEAKTAYQEALAIKAGEAHPTGRITEIDKKIADAAANAEKEKQYNDLIAKADGLFDGEKLEEAKTAYQEALTIKAGEAHPTGRITEIDKKIADAAANAEKEKQYNDLIAKADGLFDGEKLEEAKTAYQEALTIKAGEAHPTGRITEIDKKIADAAANAEKEKQYNDLITKADGLFDGEKLEEAKTAYQEALAIKAGEAHPTGRITEIDKKIADAAANAEKEKQYNDLITKADGLFDGKKLEEAKTAYQEALTIKTGEAHPTGRITEIDKKIADAAANAEKEKQYNDLIAKADGLFDGEKLEEAKTAYQEALTIKVGEAHPTGRITEIDKKIADAAANAEKEKQYNDLIAKADGLFDGEKLEEAKTAYQEALAIKAGEAHPTDRVAEINKKLNDLSSQAELEKKYNDLIAKADGLFDGDNLENAKASYQEALGIKPGEAHPTSRITEIDKKIADAAANAEKEKQYNDLIAKADGLFDGEKLEEAKTAYQEALAIKAGEAHPTDRVAEINKKLNDLSSQAELEKKYNDLIAKADGLFDGDDLENAKASYQEALGIKPGEAHPTSRITEIDKKIADAAANAEKEKQYNDLIAKADGLFDGEKLEEAKTAYQEALAIKAGEAHPTDRVAEINKKLNDLSSQAELEKKYNDLIAKADGLFDGDDLENAKASYQEALGIKPGEAHPTSRIAEIDKILADLAAANSDAAAKKALQDKFDGLMAKADELRDAKSYEEAKETYKAANQVIATEPRPQVEIDKINQILKENSGKEAYQKIIDKANELFGAKEYEKSKGLFERAKGLNPEDTYPPEKITEIDKILADLAAANSDAAAKKALQDKFDGLMAKADELRDAKSYEEAKETYKAANQVIATEPRPQVEIDKINQILKENSGKEAYQKIIDKANELFGAKEYEKSKGLFERAKGLNPEDTYPPEKITEIDKILADLAAANSDAAAKKALQDKFDGLMAKADELRDAKSYEEAKETYKAANQVIATEPRPQVEIDKINQILKENSGKEAYQKIIDKANELFGAKEYEKSKGLFERAKGLNPEDTYPPEKIAEIEKILSDLAAANSDAAAKKALQDKFDGLMAKADELRDAKSYEEAKETYKAANQVIATEPRPQVEIDKINDILLSDKDKQVEEQYRKIISKADELFTAKSYEKAKGLYERAKGFKPSDSYPPAQISKIEDILASLASEEELNKKYNDYIAKADDKFDSEQYQEALNNYQSALTLKPSKSYPKEKIEELKLLLNKKEEPIATNPGEIPAYVFGPYGEEITDLDESTADNLLQNAQINKDDLRQKQMSERKEKESETQNDNSENQQNINDKLNEQFSDFQKDKSENEFNLNEKSKENAPKIEQYKTQNNEIIHDNQNVAKELTYDINSAQTDFKSERTLKNIEDDNKSREHVPDITIYKNERGNKNFDATLENKDVTYSSFKASDNIKTERTLAKIKSDTKSQENIPEIANYKNQRENDQIQESQEGQESTYTNYTEKENLIDRFEDIYENSDSPRERNVDEVIAFENSLNFKEFKNYDNAKNLTLENAEASKDFHTERSNKNLEGIEMQVENAPKIEEYKSSMTDNNNSETELAQNKSDKLNEANEDFSQKQEKTNAEIKKINVKNTEEILDYKNKKETESTNKTNSSIDKIDEGMDNIEEIKGQKSTKFSDENQNYLASQFPEGVTEKTFQRKDKNENVIEVTTIRIVVRGNKGDEHKKVATRWATNYFKNGQPTSAQIWDTETN